MVIEFEGDGLGRHVRGVYSCEDANDSQAFPCSGSESPSAGAAEIQDFASVLCRTEHAGGYLPHVAR